MTSPHVSADPSATTAPSVGATGSQRPISTGDTATRKKRTWIGASIVTVALVASITVWATHKPPEAAAVVPDVPRVEGERIVFSAAFAERIGLERTQVERSALTPVISVVGTVALNPEYLAAIGTRLKGLVRTVKRFEGDVVEKGELLAEVESAELGEAQTAVTTLAAERKASEVHATREQQLLEKQLSTAREFEIAQAELTKFDALLDAAEQRVAALGGNPLGEDGIGLGRHAIRSPIAGTLIERHISAGQSVEADLVAFRVANLDHLWIELAVFERNLNLIRVDDKVVLSPLSDPTESIVGRVAHIGARIDSDTRSADVRIAVDNKDRTLRPGQAVTARIEATKSEQKPLLIVPSTAVTVIDGQPTVFVSDTPTSVRAVAVELGQSDGDRQQIATGVKEGEFVVSKGVFALKSELFR